MIGSKAPLALVVFALGGCAVGVEPPPPTAMVRVDATQPFAFGPDAPCHQQQDQICSAGSPKDLLLVQGKEPQLTLNLGTTFWIDAHEVTNLQYEFCVAMGECPAHPIVNAVSDPAQQNYYDNDAFSTHPVVQVSFAEAEAYCKFVGKRLPTEFEWERVARGTTGRTFPAEEMDTAVESCINLQLPTQFCRASQDMLPAPERQSDGSYESTTTKDYVVENGEKIFYMFGNAAEWTSSFQGDSITDGTPITCKDQAPCDPCWECADADTDCLAKCGDCPACGDIDEGTCHFICTGDPAPIRQTVVCTRYDAARELSPSEITPGSGNTRVIRGGSVFDGSADRCYSFAGIRDRATRSALEPGTRKGFIGFRCAKDFEATDPAGNILEPGYP